MFQTLKNTWHIADLRKKILYTLMILVLFRLGTAVPVPFLDAQVLQQMLQNLSLIHIYKNDQFIKSASNIPGVKTALVNTLNVYDIVNCDKFIVAKDAVAKLGSVSGGSGCG